MYFISGVSNVLDVDEVEGMKVQCEGTAHEDGREVWAENKAGRRTIGGCSASEELRLSTDLAR